MPAGETSFLAPYATPEDAARAKTRVLWVLGAAALAYLGVVVSMIFSEPSGSGAGGGPAPGGGTLFAVGPVVALLVSYVERRKLEVAAGRKLYNFEVAAIANCTAAGQVVGDADLGGGQEYFARRHMSVAAAAGIGAFLTVLVLVPLLLFLAWGFLSPLVFVVAASLVTASAGYAAWGMVRRAQGATAVNALFDAPLSPEEEGLLGDGAGDSMDQEP